jgi:hypothetical protein
VTRWRAAGVVLALAAAGVVLWISPTSAAEPTNQLAGYSVPSLLPGSGGPSLGAGPQTIHAQLTVPTIDCSNPKQNGEIDARVEIGGTPGQLSTPSALSTNLFARCNQVNHTITYEIIPFFTTHTPFAMNVNPGDKLVLTLRWDNDRKVVRSTAHDITTGVTESQTFVITSAATNRYAFVGMFGEPENPPFGTIQWSHMVLDNQPMGSYGGLQGYVFRIHPNHPKPVIWTTQMSPSGRSFKNIWAFDELTG